MKLDDGTEKILTFALPLPLPIVGPLGEAIEAALTAQGWTGVRYVIDGGYVVAARPPRTDRL